MVSPIESNGTPPALAIKNLCVKFPVRGAFSARARSAVHAVNHVDLRVDKGEAVGLVGESGCGKSTLCRAAVRLVPAQSGTINVDGDSWTNLTSGQLRPLRRRMQMVFQNPYASLDPRMTVCDLLLEPIRFSLKLSAREALDRVASLLEQVGIDLQSMKRFPHEFSGGQRQRIAIARAIATNPSVLIADEPVSSLDVSVQAQIINLLMDLREGMGLSILLVSHDLSVVKHICERVAVMYLGTIVETGPREDIFDRPLHPYTAALLNSAIRPDFRDAIHAPLQVLQGEPPSAFAIPSGCPFRGRCPFAIEKCAESVPPLESLDRGSGHLAACIRKGELKLMNEQHQVPSD